MTQTLRAVLAGCGGISGTWLKALKDIQEVEIVGLVDLQEGAARKRQVEYHLERAVVGTGMDKVLDATHPDLVFDCTIPEAHLPTTLAALEHGCHVLGEKPMADTMDNARRMIAAAEKAGRLYAVIQNRRYQAEIRRVRQFVESGAMGALTTLNCDFYIGAHFGGFRDVMQHPLLLDMAIHTFDAARLISGADPVSVFCKEWNPAGSWYAQGASATAIFEMSGGLVFNYRGSWCSEGFNTTWECDWRAVGQRGTLKWDGQQQLSAQVVSKQGGFFSECVEAEIPPLTKDAKIGAHAGQIQDFIRCVREGSRPETICTDNIKSLAMVHAAIQGAESGETTRVSI